MVSTNQLKQVIYRITEHLKLEHTSGDHLDPPLLKQGHILQVSLFHISISVLVRVLDIKSHA